MADPPQGRGGAGSGSAVRTIQKTATDTVNDSVALVNDSELSISVDTNTDYFFELILICDSNATPRFKLNFTFPTGATLQFNDNDDSGFDLDQVDLPHIFDCDAGARVAVKRRFEGRLTTAGTAGTFQVQFAQNVAEVSNTRIFPASVLNIQP